MEDILSIQSSRHWKWVFTTAIIQEKEIVCKVLWDLLTTQELEKDWIDSEISVNAYRYDQNHFISPWKHISNYINHSCDPNVYVEKIDDVLLIKAIKRINPLSEILLDYSTIMAKDDLRSMNCDRLSDNCRKIVLSYDKIDKKTLQYYINHKLIPDYILAIVN